MFTFKIAFQLHREPFRGTPLKGGGKQGERQRLQPQFSSNNREWGHSASLPSPTRAAGSGWGHCRAPELTGFAIQSSPEGGSVTAAGFRREQTPFLDFMVKLSGTIPLASPLIPSLP